MPMGEEDGNHVFGNWIDFNNAVAVRIVFHFRFVNQMAYLFYYSYVR